jgi:long-chain acyl-CoA synthetase
MNLASRLAASAERDPSRVAIRFRGRAITYGELESEADRVASSLLHLGAEVGDRIAIWLPNHPSFVASMYGAWRAGGIVVPINPMLTWREARYILEDSGARILFCSQAHYSEIDRTTLAELDQVVLVGGEAAQGDLSYASLLEVGVGNTPSVELADDNLALLGYTSGTTGVPKGAMLTHGNLDSNIEQMLQTPAAPAASDVALGVLPLSHIFGLNALANQCIAAGAEIVLLERFDAAAALRAVRENRITRVASAPPAYVAWLHLQAAGADDFQSVRIATSGAAPLPAEVLTAFQERFGVTIWEGYGLTETSPTLTIAAIGGTPKPGSIGRPIPGVELRLVDEDGEDAEPGDPGEIVVRGPNVFRGYWQHPDDTARALRDGWFHTGDVAVADDDGDLFLVDRKRDLILVSGFNVYPKEVEDVLLEHPSVSDAAAVGVPDSLHGEQVKAFVVAQAGADPTEEELVAFCRARIAAFKVPGAIEFVPEIPRNAAGKVLRRELR